MTFSSPSVERFICRSRPLVGAIIRRRFVFRRLRLFTPPRPSSASFLIAAALRHSFDANLPNRVIRVTQSEALSALKQLWLRIHFEMLIISDARNQNWLIPLGECSSERHNHRRKSWHLHFQLISESIKIVQFFSRGTSAVARKCTLKQLWQQRVFPWIDKRNLHNLFWLVWRAIVAHFICPPFELFRATKSRMRCAANNIRRAMKYIGWAIGTRALSLARPDSGGEMHSLGSGARRDQTKNNRVDCFSRPCASNCSAYRSIQARQTSRSIQFIPRYNHIRSQIAFQPHDKYEIYSQFSAANVVLRQH